MGTLHLQAHVACRHRMNRLYTFLILQMCCLAAWTQAPATMTYQAVLRDNAGNQLVNQTVTIEFAIRENDPEGIIVFEEYHNLIPTNQFGLISTLIGNGVNTGNGTFNSLTEIPWGQHVYFLEVRAVIPGEGSPQLIGVSQLVTVPYAYYSKQAETVVNESDGDTTNELIEDFSLNGSVLTITENNVDYAVDLSTISGSDNDNASDNELITSMTINDLLQLEIEEGTHVTNADLSALAFNTWSRNADGIYNTNDQVGVGTSAPNSTLDVGGSFGLSVTTLIGEDFDLNLSPSSAATAVFICDVTSQDVNVQLISATNCPGRIYKFRKFFTGTSTTNNVNIIAPVGESIDMMPTYQMSNQYAEYVTIISNGSNWFLIEHSKD